jgi:hypothetical protein
MNGSGVCEILAMESDMKQLVAVLALLAFLPLLGRAQVSASGIIVNVDFSFYAGAKLQPAGSYEFRPMSGNVDNALQVVNLKTRESTVVLIITSVSKKQPEGGEAVFDQTGGNYYLSEVYIPRMEGILLQGAPAKHTHVIIKAQK